MLDRNQLAAACRLGGCLVDCLFDEETKHFGIWFSVVIIAVRLLFSRSDTLAGGVDDGVACELSSWSE